jgi:hypothetical protein
VLVWPGCLDPDASAGRREHQEGRVASPLPKRNRARGRGQFAGRNERKRGGVARKLRLSFEGRCASMQPTEG